MNRGTSDNDRLQQYADAIARDLGYDHPTPDHYTAARAAMRVADAVVAELREALEVAESDQP